jgi:hypothetical protein
MDFLEILLQCSGIILEFLGFFGINPEFPRLA